MKSLKIENKNISLNNNPFIIAEMSGNHNQSLDKALQIVTAAAESGVHALKLQTYKPETITLDIREREFLIKDEKSLWKGQSLYDLYEIAQTPWEWHQPIIEKANKLGLICFSSPFDETAVDFLEELNVPAYKIASFEINHLPLIEKIALTGKPVIISTGMASINDIEQAIKILKDHNCLNFALLKCTTSYPASPKNSNIKTIPHMRELFQCEIGLSDHTMGIGASIAAISHGATIIEKHFTIDRSKGGVDSQFSLEPNEMKALVIESKRAYQSLGKVTYGPTNDEKNYTKHRRSIYFKKEIKKDEVIKSDSIKIIRPGLGLAPKNFYKVIGKRAKDSIKRGTPVNWNLLY
tara:strand:+ start:17530 stop:18582 length:1053 start_codon:yes stop_codon:yes gene_type:complete